MDDKARVRHILDAHEHLVLATADEQGRPWVTPASYTPDQDRCLYWMSDKDARHSSNIRNRSGVAIVIYATGKDSDALYIEAEARELSGTEEINNAIKIIDTRPHPEKFRIGSVDDVSGDGAWRIYKAVPKAMYVRKQSSSGGQPVTVRRQLDVS
jgi:nitroimidazol reductase NimA-like FMN-containing flavoprotein (pyridoxamine 5'-phosphate oxidase superfamily)